MVKSYLQKTSQWGVDFCFREGFYILYIVVCGGLSYLFVAHHIKGLRLSKRRQQTHELRLLNVLGGRVSG